MHTKTSFYTGALLILLTLLVFGAASFTLGSPDFQIDPTAQQMTVNAVVAERFTQTQQAAGRMLTVTADAQLTLVFEETISAAFMGALTATAQAVSGTQAPVVTATPTPSQTPPPTEAGPLGVELILRPATDFDTAVLNDAAAVLSRRLQAYNLGDATVEVQNTVIVVRIPAGEDQEAAMEAVQQRGLLEFVDLSGVENALQMVDQVISTSETPDREGAQNEQPYETILTSSDIVQAEAVEMNGMWSVTFQFSEGGGERLNTFTGENVGEPLAIAVDGRILIVALIQSAFGTTGGVLSANFTQAEAESLALILNSGVLPVPLTVESINTFSMPTAVAVEPITPSPTPDIFPTATVGEVQVAEQVFEGGRMFYVQPVGQIWVMLVESEGRGTWQIYEDTFVEGEPETDPSIVPPEGLYQPTRGFGKLWRENDAVRDALGWALTPEFGYASEYRYYPGGEAVNGQYVAGPGYHVLFSLYEEAFRFNEADNTWQLNQE